MDFFEARRAVDFADSRDYLNSVGLTDDINSVMG